MADGYRISYTIVWYGGRVNRLYRLDSERSRSCRVASCYLYRRGIFGLLIPPLAVSGSVALLALW